ncbi:MAG: methyltransferase domain-containing protein [Anaerolineae bacterium]|nr:methyltransferase domain-containing protein [Anaerolineae bacterium]
MQSVFAVTARGLEAVSLREMRVIPGIQNAQTAYRRVLAECDSLLPLLSLRTVDDVFLQVAIWPQIDHTRSALGNIQDWSAEFDLPKAAGIISKIRPIAQIPSFSVTANFVGKRNYSSEEIKSSVAAGIQEQWTWNYLEDDRESDFNIRVFIEHQTALVGLRLGKRPLHERSYKQVQRPGSLKPSVAATMLILADLKPGEHLLDPCCGVGTIIIEGAVMGAVVQGGDVDSEAVEAANANAASANIQTRFEQWDARNLSLLDGSVDCVVSNLPWGRQIQIDADLKAFYRDICTEIERVIRPDGRVVLLTTMPDLLNFKRLRLVEQIEISLFGQNPIISVFKIGEI